MRDECEINLFETHANNSFNRRIFLNFQIKIIKFPTNFFFHLKSCAELQLFNYRPCRTSLGVSVGGRYEHFWIIFRIIRGITSTNVQTLYRYSRAPINKCSYTNCTVLEKRAVLVSHNDGNISEYNNFIATSVDSSITKNNYPNYGLNIQSIHCVCIRANEIVCPQHNCLDWLFPLDD